MVNTNPSASFYLKIWQLKLQFKKKINDLSGLMLVAKYKIYQEVLGYV